MSHYQRLLVLSQYLHSQYKPRIAVIPILQNKMANGDAGHLYRRFSLSSKIVDFAKQTISSGVSRGNKIKIGRLKNLLGMTRQRKYGFSTSAPLYLTDDTIIKYINHPKAKKGATVPVELLPAVARALNNPKALYIDRSGKNTARNNLVFVGVLTHPAYKGKVIKAVVHVDFKVRGEIFHKVKSFGIVDKTNMDNRIYHKVK